MNSEESAGELPKGWTLATLGEIANWGSGGTPKSGEPSFYDGEIPWAVIGDLNDGVVHSTARCITQAGLENSAAKIVPVGSLLLAMYGASIGKLGMAGVKMATNQAIAFTPPVSAIDSKYLFYYLLGQRSELVSKGKGAAQKNISQQIIKEWPVPLAPLEEQRRIVAALEEQLSSLASGVEILRGALTKSDALRRKILSKLTTPPTGGWAEYKLGDLATSVRNGMYVSRPGMEPNGVAILRIGAVRPLRLDLTDLRYSRVEEKAVADDGYLLSQGDLLFTRYNGNPAYVGACAVVPDRTGALTYPDKLIRVRLDRDVADPEFVAMACTGGSTRRVIQSAVKTTAGQAGIAGKDLKRVPIWLPSIESQQERVRMYRDWDAVVSRLEVEIAKGESRSERLRRSLLAKAFAGRLVPQDPSDEPADSLLARIRAVRETAGAAKSRRRSPRRTPAQRKRTPDNAPSSDAPPPPSAGVPASATAIQPTLDMEIPS